MKGEGLKPGLSFLRKGKQGCGDSMWIDRERKMVTEKQLEKQEVTWHRPRFLRREYELVVVGQVMARLRQVGFLRPQAEIFEVAGLDSELVLKCERTGLFRQKLHIKTVDLRFPTTPPAGLSWKGEITLHLDNGRIYNWRPANFWQKHWLLTDESGRELMRIERKTIGYGGQISIQENDLEAEEERFLLYVGWYLVILKMDDGAAAAAAGGS
jgi:hypothetical protein